MCVSRGGNGTLLGREGHREEGGVTEPSGLTLSNTPNMGGWVRGYRELTVSHQEVHKAQVVQGV